jgi:ammonium transporter, Amt family
MIMTHVYYDEAVSWGIGLQFAATAATIVSGAVAERCKFEGYLAYAALLTSWVYPIIVHCAS